MSSQSRSTAARADLGSARGSPAASDEDCVGVREVASGADDDFSEPDSPQATMPPAVTSTSATAVLLRSPCSILAARSSSVGKGGSIRGSYGPGHPRRPPPRRPDSHASAADNRLLPRRRGYSARAHG